MLNNYGLFHRFVGGICGIFQNLIPHSTFDIRHSTLRQAGGEGRTPLSPELIPVAALAAPRLRTPELDPAVQPVLRAPPGLLRLI